MKLKETASYFSLCFSVFIVSVLSVVKEKLNGSLQITNAKGLSKKNARPLWTGRALTLINYC